MTVDASNLLSALLGAAVGSLVTVVIYLHDRGRQERAAMRAVHAELLMVGTYIQGILKESAIVGPMSLPALQTQLPRMASRLSADELSTLAAAAMLMPTLQKIQDSVGPLGAGLSEDRQAALRAGYGSVMEAAEILRRKAY